MRKWGNFDVKIERNRAKHGVLGPKNKKKREKCDFF